MAFFLSGHGANGIFAVTLFSLFVIPAPATAQAPAVAATRPPVLAGQVYKHSSGWSFRVPQGWTVQADDQEQFKIAPPGADAGGEGYGLGYTPGPKIDDVAGATFVRTMETEMKRLLPFLSRVGEARRLTISFGPAAVLTWGGETPDGTRIRARTYTAPFADGAISLLAFGTPENMDRRDGDLRAVFASLRREALPKEDPDTPLAKLWRKKLSGKKLTKIENYNGGSSGGYNSRLDIVLRTDGRLTFAGDSSVSIYIDGGNSNGGNSSGTKKGEGRWRIFSRGSQALLAVTAEGHPTEYFVLSEDQGKTLLNGRRWFVTAP